MAATTDARTLIINADDFGLSEGINRGIVESFIAGALRSTSIMVGMPAFEDAVQHSRIAGDSLGVGLHFTLTSGRPLTRSPSLVDEKTGEFLRVPALLWRACTGHLSGREVADECAAQIARARGAGLRLTHLDGHHHVHLFPVVRDAVRRVVGAEGIGVVRRPVEPFFGVPNWWRRWVARGVISGVARGIDSERWHIRTTDHFVGTTLVGAINFHAALRRLLATLPIGTTELMVHPGHMQGPLPYGDAYTTQRERELRALTSPDILERLHSGSISLRHFGEL